jgi:uncharacterized protein (TIGR03083 family)
MAIDFLASIETDSRSIVELARKGPLDAAVPACPGWDVARLTSHLGRVQRWCTAALRSGQEPGRDDFAPAPREPDAAADYLDGAYGPLLDALRAVDPAGACWNFTGRDQTGAFWPRRQAHEAAVHRWDAEQAVGHDPAAFNPALAADGIDEIFEVWVPLGLKPGMFDGSLHVHTTDAECEWIVRGDQVARGHEKGDVALRGPASSVLLGLWRRINPGDGGTEVVGDQAVLDRWLGLGVP